jgi:hypothetical protein
MAQPFDNRPGVIWMDGQFVPWADAKLHVLSHGLHYASSVFEGERAYGASSASTFLIPQRRSTRRPPSCSSVRR